MRFKATAGPDDFLSPSSETGFNLRVEQINAALHRTFSPDILQEQDKLTWADAVLFHFPMWWYSVPAILKGWFDRVLTYGFAYGLGSSLKGRRAMLCVTTGGPTRVFTPDLRDTVSQLLDHVQRSVLYFCGFDVLPPFAVYGAANATPQQREQIIQQYSERLDKLPNMPPLQFNR